MASTKDTTYTKDIKLNLPRFMFVKDISNAAIKEPNYRKPRYASSLITNYNTAPIQKNDNSDIEQIL